MKHMIITGGSRGIGAATALAAARENYAVVVNFRSNEEAARKIVRTIRQAGGTAIAIGADVSSAAGLNRLFDEAEASFGRLDVLVNNAGLLERQSPAMDISAERLQRVFTTNVVGAFLCAKEAATRMSAAHGGKGGSIVNVSSRAAVTGAPFEYVDYAASKAALDALTTGMAKEWASMQIRVNAVRPAFIYTDIHAAGGDPHRIEKRKGLIPMRRGGDPQEVAEAILWLASEKASYVTGAFLDVAGGA